MQGSFISSKKFRIAVLVACTVMFGKGAYASDAERKTPEGFAQVYFDTFNSHDLAALRKLRLQTSVKSPMQDMLDGMEEAAIKDGKKYNKFEVLPLTGDVHKPQMGLDGMFYKPTMMPTNLVKFSMVEAGGSMSSTIPIGIKDGIYYEITVLPDLEHSVPFAFGWQRASLPKTNWSVMFPNEPEPGKAALEKDMGKAAADNPDSYGVMTNNASIKTEQHWIRCGEEGKRVNDPTNQETYRAACTTYEPETLKKWFADPNKNIDDAIGVSTAFIKGGTVKKTAISLNGAPGREFEVKESDGTFHLGRTYWVNDRLYELSFVSKKDSPDLNGANKFLNSLEVK